MTNDDKELLIRLEEKLISFGKNLDQFFKIVEEHMEDDKRSMEKLGSRISSVERIAYVGIGGLAVFQFVLTFFKP